MTDGVHAEALLAIVSMAVITAGTRLAGFFLMRYVPVTPRVRRMLEALPGSVIVAIVLPQTVRGGPVMMVAVLAGMAAMLVLRNDLVAIVVGVASAAVLRGVGFG